MKNIVEQGKKYVKNKIDAYKWREHKESYGNENQSYYVLRRYHPFVGIGSHIIVFLGMLKHMEEMFPESIAVVDLKNYKQSISDVDNENAWEKFFLQPNANGHTVQNIKRSKNVILSDGFRDSKKAGYDIPSDFDYKMLCEKGWNYYFNKYIKLRWDLKKEFDLEWDAFVGNNTVLGVKARGTDYNTLKLKGHNIQPTVNQLIEKTKSFMEKKCYDKAKVLLATEDSSIVDEFMKKFDREVIIRCGNDLPVYTDGMIMNNNGTKKSKYEISKQYLKEMYFLSKCDVLISGKSSGVVPTLLWNRGGISMCIYSISEFIVNRERAA